MLCSEKAADPADGADKGVNIAIGKEHISPLKRGWKHIPQNGDGPAVRNDARP